VFTGATLPSAPSITLNPAALGLGTAFEVYVALAGVLDQYGIDRKVIQDASGDLVDGPRVHDVAAAAGAEFATIWHPGRVTTLGLQLRIPPSELFPADPALRYHSLGSFQRNFTVTGGFSLRVSGSFYFGVSLSHDVSYLRLRYARDTALDVGLDADCLGQPCGIENDAAAEIYDIKVRSKRVSTENLAVNLGVAIQLARDFWLGLAYHNTPGFGIQSQLDGDVAIRRAARDGGGTLDANSTVLVSYPASVDGEVRARVLPDLDAHVGGRWIDLSRMQSYDVRVYGPELLGTPIPEWTLRPRGFRDSFALWLGAEQVELRQDKRLRVGARIGLETPALKTARTSPGNMSPTSLTLDVGAQIRIAPSWAFQIGYGAQLFSKVSVESSDYNPLFATDCRATEFDYSTRACEALRDGYAIPTAAGDYTRTEHTVRLGFRYERL